MGLLVSLQVSAQQELILPVISITDGDTIKSYIPLPGKLSKVSIRIRGIDTPEIRSPKCWKEKKLALIAKERLIIKVGHEKFVTVKNPKWGKYGGRIIGDVFAGDVNIAEYMISEGVAVPYLGKRSNENC